MIQTNSRRSKKKQHALDRRPWKPGLAPSRGLMVLCLMLFLGFLLQPIKAQDDLEVRHNKAIALAREGRSDEALAILEALLEETEWKNFILYDYLLALSWDSRFGDVLNLADRIHLKTAPGHVLNALAVSSRHEERYDMAREYYGEIVARDPSNLEAVIQMWIAEAESGDPLLASESLEKLVPDHELNIPLLLALARIAATREDPVDERLWYRRILKHFPNNEVARKGLMSSMLPNSSEVGFEDASAIDRASFAKDLDAEHDRAVFLARDGNYDESLSLLEVLLFQTEWTETILHDYLIILSWSGDYERVLEHAARLKIDKAPRQVAAAIAWSARELERYEYARTLYQDMIQRFPDQLDVHLGYFLCTAEAGNPETALEGLKALAVDHPQDKELLGALAYVAKLTGNESMSRTLYRRLLELDPFHSEAREALSLGRDNPQKTLEEATGFSLFQLEAIHDELEHIATIAADGQTDQALTDIDCLMDATDSAPVVFNHYILYLHWSDRDRDVLEYLDVVDPYHVPFDALNSFANAARHERYFELGRDLYKIILERDPQNMTALTGIQICIAELEGVEQPIFALKSLLRQHPRNLDIMATLAYLYKLDHNQIKQFEYFKLMTENSDQEGALRILRAANLSLDVLVPDEQAHISLLEQARERQIFFSSDHEIAVQLAREARYEEAIQTLECLLSYPQPPERVFEDYIVVLSWAGRDQEVVSFLPEIDPYNTPSYVLEAMAKSARNLKNYYLGEALYEVILHRMPKHVNSLIGLQMCKAGSGSSANAFDALFKVLQHNPNHPKLLYSVLDLAVEQRNYFAQITVYQRLLENDPNNQDAKQGLVLATSRMGSPELALDMLEKDPSIQLTPAMLEQILGDRAARRVIWGRLDQETTEARFVETDLSIQLLYDNLAANEPFGEERLGEILRTQWDRLCALRDRVLMEECVKLYEELEHWHDRVPAFALAAVADAYIHQKQPRKALNLYHKALNMAPGMYTARLNLYYAYLESEDNDTAIEHINNMAAAEPPWFRLPGSRVRGKNDAKLSADLSSFLAQSFVDRNYKAQPNFEEWLSRGPFNESIRQGLANVYLWRGWPQKAMKHYDIILQYSPENIAAQLWRVYALMDLGRYKEAKPVVTSLFAAYPEKSEIQKLARDWEAHEGFRFHSEGIASEGTGDNQGQHELTWDTWLFGPSMGHWLKPFAHHYYASSQFFNGPVLYRRIGAGLNLRYLSFTGLAEVHADNLDYENPGYTLELSYRANDYWRFSGSYNSYSNDLPLKGRPSGLNGSEVSFSVDWRSSDLLNAGFSFKHSEFNDGNTRETALLSGFRSLYLGPRYRAFGNLGFYGGRNDGGPKIYFNPEEEASGDLTLDQYFLNYRFYERKFNHRLVLGYGYYWQTNFDADWTGTVRYEHHWDINERFGFLYGYSRTRRMYDGAAEYATNYYTTIEWRF